MNQTPGLRQAVVLDCEGLSRAVGADPYIRSLVNAAYLGKRRVIVSVVTLIEATHPGLDRGAYNWVVSRLSVVPLTKELASAASQLLEDAGRHGQSAAIDAIVCATALDADEHPLIFTSDPDDLRALTGNRASIVPLR